ncbi:MAG TPA: response regulator transcription factor [Candidatus Merdenecus merdavium]|nr:response regulator transcription factor [Candidatus Merdenecus merdavium]
MKDPKPVVLVVEDEESIGHFIETNLYTNGYKPIRCSLGKEAISLVSSHCPDLVLLDLGLPDIAGLEVLKQIRTWSELPIIVVSARDRETDKVKALDLGADDYITKPFGTSELMARIRAALRYQRRLVKQGGVSTSVYKVKDLEMNFEKHKITLKGEKIHLTAIEFKLVSLLAKNAGKVLTYETMMKEIWGPYANEGNQILRVNMANIRRKIERNPADPQYIFTEVGVGYRMAEDG